MVMRDIDSFHCPEPRFISRGVADGNKPGQGAMETACIPKLQYFNCFFCTDTIHLCPFICIC